MDTVLVAILFCLALQRLTNVGGQFSSIWFARYLQLGDRWLLRLDEWLALFLIVAPIWLVLGALHWLFRDSTLGWLNLCLSVVVLFFTIDARDLKIKLAPYFDALEELDLHRAMQLVGDFIDDRSVGNIPDLQRAVSRAILRRSFERVFVGLFWFVVTGVYGAAAYFVVTMLRQQGSREGSSYARIAEIAAKFQGGMEWLPARAVGFSYALVGRFTQGFNYCVANFWGDWERCRDFAVAAGLVALEPGFEGDQQGKENRDVLDLINRAIIVWLIVILLILFGVLL